MQNLLCFVLLLGFATCRIVSSSAIILKPQTKVRFTFCPGQYIPDRYTTIFTIQPENKFKSCEATNPYILQFPNLPIWLKQKNSILQGQTPKAQADVKYNVTIRYRNSKVRTQYGIMRFFIVVGKKFQEKAQVIHPIYYELGLHENTTLWYRIVCPPIDLGFPEFFKPIKPQPQQMYLNLNYDTIIKNFEQISNKCKKQNDQFKAALFEYQNHQSSMSLIVANLSQLKDSYMLKSQIKNGARSPQEQNLQQKIENSKSVIESVTKNIEEQQRKITELNNQLQSLREQRRKTFNNMQNTTQLDSQIIALEQNKTSVQKIVQAAKSNLVNQQNELNLAEEKIKPLKQESQKRYKQYEREVQDIQEKIKTTNDLRLKEQEALQVYDLDMKKKKDILLKCINASTNVKILGDLTCKRPVGLRPFIETGVVLHQTQTTLLIGKRELLIGQCSIINNRKKSLKISVQDYVLYEAFESQKKHWIVKMTTILSA